MSYCKTFQQIGIKLKYSTLEQLIEQINRLGASSEHPLHISPTTPDFTDTLSWVEVNYWKQI